MAKNKKSTIKSKTLQFYFTGESMTNLIRDFWNSNLPKKAIECLTTSGIPEEVALKICTGEYKCSGDTRVGDHTLGIENDKNPGKIYFTLESQIKKLEDNFIKISKNLMLISQGTLAASDEKVKSLNEEKKSILDNIEIVYRLTNKTLSELPISKIFEDNIIEEKTQTYFDPASEDQQDDETDDEYFFRMKKLAILRNPIVKWKNSKLVNAWISPDGKIYDVSLQPFPMHVNAASDYKYMGLVPENSYAYDASAWLDKNGWMKLTSDSFYIDTKLSQAQIDVLMDYMVVKNKKKISWFGSKMTLDEILKENEN